MWEIIEAQKVPPYGSSDLKSGALMRRLLVVASTALAATP